MSQQGLISTTSIRAITDPLKIPVIDDGGHGGIGHDDLNDPEDGVVLSIQMGPDFFQGDFIELFWDDVRVQAFPVTAEHYATRIIGFSVLPQYILRPGIDLYVAKVYYVITDEFTGTSAKLEPPREVLVKNTVPGNPDPVPDTPFLNENLLAPAGVPAEITPPVTELTLTVNPWEYMHDADKLTTYWGGTQNSKMQDIVGVGRAQTVTIPPEMIVKGGDSPNLRVLYAIRDLASNWSLYSEAALTNVSIDPSLPGAPRVLDDGRPTLKIDLDTAGAHIITVAIPVYVNALEVKAQGENTRKGRMALGDNIKLTWAGETAEGLPLVYEPPIQPVTDTGFGPIFDIPTDYVTRIANGLAKVFYEVYPVDGTANRFSRSSTVTVVRKQVEQLVAPELLDAKGGTSIDPADVPASGASVEIPVYTGKKFGDIIYLQWEGKNSIGDPVVYEDNHSVPSSEEKLPYVFVVDKTEILRLAGGSLKLSYHVKFFNSIDLPSALSNYTVIGQTLLPMPAIDHVAEDAILDPDLHPTTTVRVDGVKAILKVGDEVTIYWAGVPGPGTSVEIFRVGVDNQNLSWPIINALVEANRDAVVQVRYSVARATGGQQNSEINRIQVKAIGPVTGDESFELQPLRQLPLNVKLPFANGLSITVTAASLGTEIVTPGINEFGDKALYCAGANSIKFEFGGQVSRVLLSHAVTATTSNKLDFHSDSGGLVHSINLAPIPAGETVVYENVALPNPCAYCILTVDNIGLIMDNLIWM
ncbi:MAG TPA: hypothetical protein VF682_26450 [Pseudomonas sp.]|jgi:hypothetical protein